MESNKYPEVTVTVINRDDIKKISNEKIVLKRKSGKKQREILTFQAIDTTDYDSYSQAIRTAIAYEWNELPNQITKAAAALNLKKR